MYIQLEDTLADASFNFDDLDNLHALENIFSAGFSGDHLVRCSKKVLLILEENRNRFGSRTQRVIEKLKALSFQGMAPDFLRGVMSKIYINHTVSTVTKLDDGWRVPLNIFYDNSLVVRPLLLCEDLTDAEVLEYAAKHYVLVNKIRGCKISVRLEGGGGSCITDRLDYILRAQRDFVLCITDSDKLSPSDNLDDTAGKCANLIKSSNWVARYLPTPGRELENLIPWRFIDQALNVDCTRRWEVIKRLCNIAGSSVADYIDIKEGVRNRWVLEMPDGSPNRMYWEAIIDLLKEKDPQLQALLDKCNHSSKDACECYVFPNVAKRTADQVLGWLKINTPHKSAESLERRLDDDWVNIGREIFDFCCGDDKIRL
ncbi:MAG: hypothetical protein Q7T36_16890 [Fluviicoccus sp.]|uniref:hypothetical protein n=1 Tax=Fluviicoccus sp. TaxID=2003552 RepID=UPI00271726D8|nr:hypothetical protein [Fluviicoccus sp.]MDO8332144.1 hypothetical protein [Fluviicoccus sp.]